MGCGVSAPKYTLIQLRNEAVIEKDTKNLYIGDIIIPKYLIINFFKCQLGTEIAIIVKPNFDDKIIFTFDDTQGILKDLQSSGLKRFVH